MTDTSLLHRLQSIDSGVDVKQARLDEINALLGENQEVQAAIERLETAEKSLQAAQAQVSDLELEIASLDEKTQTATDRLYSGSVTNPKELQDMEQELEALGRRREALEDQLLEAMATLEDVQEQAEIAGGNLKDVESKWADNQGDLVGEKKELEAALEDLSSKRESVLAEVDNGTLETYESLRSQRRGLAVATVKDGVCTACGVAPTSSVLQKARHGDSNARCPTCGRILYVG